MTAALLLDNSAWSRLADPALRAERSEEVAAALEAGDLVVCMPFLLEAGYSARNGAQHTDLLDELLSLPHVEIDATVEERAIDVQRQLTRVGHHRLPPVDLLVGALAERHGLGVLHYDHDYDLLIEKSDLRFESVWLAPRGTL